MGTKGCQEEEGEANLKPHSTEFQKVIKYAGPTRDSSRSQTPTNTYTQSQQWTSQVTEQIPK